MNRIHTYTYTRAIKSVQINLHQSKAVTATLYQQPAEGKEVVALMLELWTYRGQMRGLTITGEQFIPLHLNIMQGPVFMSGITLMPYLCWISVLETQQR
jgi:hypothetical protein